MGFCAFLVDIFLQIMNSAKYKAVEHVVGHTGGFWGPYIVWLCFTIGFSTISGCIVSFVAPLAAGSGIPETKTYLNGVHIKGGSCTPACNRCGRLCCSLAQAAGGCGSLTCHCCMLCGPGMPACMYGRLGFKHPLPCAGCRPLALPGNPCSQRGT